MGLALSLDEDRLDEIFTINETDEACLQAMLELFMMRLDINISWEEIYSAERKVRVNAVGEMKNSRDVAIPQKKSDESDYHDVTPGE